MTTFIVTEVLNNYYLLTIKGRLLKLQPDTSI